MPKQIFHTSKPSDRTDSSGESHYRHNFYPALDSSAAQHARTVCPRCGIVIGLNTQFCLYCGQKLASTTYVGSEWLKARPSICRRLCAEIIDRLAPFAIAPIIAIPMTPIGLNGFFWTWNGVAFLWHLLRDCSANRRSLGKWLCRLRVVSVNGGKQCAWQRVIARRLLSALSQSVYCIAIVAFWLRPETGPWPLFTQFANPLLLLALGYDFASLASILITDGGRRIEDLIVHTCVVCEAAYKRDRKKCGACGALVSKSETYCWRCGGRNAPEIKIRRMIEQD